MKGSRPYSKTVPPLELLPHEAAWLAGIIDGEGSINLYRNNNTKISTLRIDCTLCANTDDGILYEVLRLVPWARVYRNAKKGDKAKSAKYAATKDCYSITVTAMAGQLEVMQAVLPYLKGAKRLRAVACMAYIKERLLHP